MSATSFRMLIKALAIGTALTATAGVQAQGYPSEPINYVIPFNPGGESDVSARFQQAVSEQVAGVKMVIQYMPGAGGAKGWSKLNSMPGDGYTMMGINLPHSVLQPMQKDVGYKSEDLAAVHYFHYTPDAIFVQKDSPFKTLGELIEHARKTPGAVTFSGSSSYSSNHLAQARLDDLAGIKTTYIPFSGTGPAIAAVLGKQTVAGFNFATSAIAHAEDMRMLAVASEQRMPAFPDVPTFRELGYDLVGGAYRGLAVPALTPEEQRQKLSEIVSTINADPGFRKKMEDGGFVLTDVTYDKMPAFMAAKRKEYTELADKLGIKSN